jgi:hypothetical protein
MTAQIKLKKLSGIQVNNKKAVVDGTSSPGGTETLLNTGINALNTANQKIVFAGQDYKGTFTITDPKASNAIPGDLELYLERPDNHFTIKDIKINKNGSHTLTNNGKDATIELTGTTNNAVTEKDSGWFATELSGTATALKFGEWNDYNLPDKCYVDISFA